MFHQSLFASMCECDCRYRKKFVISESPPRQRRRHARDNDQDVLSSDSEFDLLELPPFTVGGTKRFVK